MKKNSCFLIIFCAALLLSSCGFTIKIVPSKTETGVETGIPSENTDTDETEASIEASADTAETTETAAPEEEVISEDTDDLTLAGIKSEVEAAGYTVEGGLDEYQTDSDPKPADGFNWTYEDEYSMSNIPVYEFNNAEDALAYAKQINAEGYSRAVVNGKFVTMTRSSYGIVDNENEKSFLERLLKTQISEYVESEPVLLQPAEDYAGACLQIRAITAALDKLVNKSVILHDKTAPEGLQVKLAFISFYMLNSGDLSFTASLCEDQAEIDAIVQLWQSWGVGDFEIIHDNPHEYVMTGTRMGMETTFEIECSFHPETGSLRLIDTDGGQMLELYEFVPLGDDKYAFQTQNERAIVEYKEGRIVSFIYTLNRSEDFVYQADTDGIFGECEGIDEAWVLAKGEENYDQFLVGKDGKLYISAVSFTSDDRFILETDIQ